MVSIPIKATTNIDKQPITIQIAYTHQAVEKTNHRPKGLDA